MPRPALRLAPRLRNVPVLLALLQAACCGAAVDANLASEAELDGIRGVGPGLSARILQERSKAPFRDWNDFIGRVAGVGKGTAARISREGLTVNGQGYEPPAQRAGRAPGAPGAPRTAPD